METRTRVINQTQNYVGSSLHLTRGCLDSLSESRACGKPCEEMKVCEVAVWSDWSKCDYACGGGQRSRKRTIAQKPSGGGAACGTGVATELEACNTHQCKGNCTPKNAEWGNWTLVGGCSSSCQGGYQRRKRSLVSEANDCGTPAEGESLDSIPCNTAVPCTNTDCTFQDWATWSKCTSHTADECEGVQKRIRGTHPKVGKGKPCDGSLEEAQSCTPADLASKCNAPPVDCLLSDWTPWDACTASCDGGQTRRMRSDLSNNITGKPCGGALSQVAHCGTTPCPGTRDCEYSDWTLWGSCQGCGGQKTRTRHIAKYHTGVGKPCATGDLDETAECPRKCNMMYCGWTSWRDWGECSADCGNGKRSRTRLLALVEKPKTDTTVAKLWDANIDENSLEDRVQELYRKAQNAEASRRSELALAFGLGAFVLLAFAAISLAIPRSRRPHLSRALSCRQGECCPESGTRHVQIILGEHGQVSADADRSEEFASIARTIELGYSRLNASDFSA